jgi:norsolorinic acid ketoreductase
MATPKTVLITGANRGIGKGFTATFLSQPATTVIAAVRDPASAAGLAELPTAEGSKLITVKLDSSVADDASNAVAKLKSEHGIEALDIVIANAGIAKNGTSVRNTSADGITEHFAVNSLGPVLLFQATADLLQASKTGNPKFVALSTFIGSIGGIDALTSLGWPNTASPYGGSKAALNWFVRRLHFEEPWLTSFVFHPGLVETDMAHGALEGTGLSVKDVGAITVDTSVSGMVKTIMAATRETSSTFQNYDGAINPW